MAPNSSKQVIAVVTPLSTVQALTGQDLYFRVRGTSSAGATISDYVKTSITVVTSSTRSFSLAPQGSSVQIAPGGAATFTHLVTNTGSQSCGATSGFNLTATLPAAAISAGWQVVVYSDTGTTLGLVDSGDTALTFNTTTQSYPLPVLAAGASHPLLLRVYAPGTAAGGTTVSVTLTVTDADTTTPNCGTQTVTSTATVTVGQLVVNKMQLLDTACTTAAVPTSAADISAKPGECIVYLATVTNNGTDPVTGVVLHDSVPAYTLYHATQPTSQCVSSAAMTPAVTLTNNTAVDGTLSCGSVGNTLNPGASITLSFRVQVKPS